MSDTNRIVAIEAESTFTALLATSRVDSMRSGSATRLSSFRPRGCSSARMWTRSREIPINAVSLPEKNPDDTVQTARMPR